MSDPTMRRILAILLADLQAPRLAPWAAMLADAEPIADALGEYVVTFRSVSGTGGAGAYFPEGLSAAETLVKVADDLQDFVVEDLAAAGLAPVWPECPLHPDTHPLTARCIDERAVWICPRTDQVIADIGRLGP